MTAAPAWTFPKPPPGTPQTWRCFGTGAPMCSWCGRRWIKGRVSPTYRKQRDRGPCPRCPMRALRAARRKTMARA